jgi:hypothetical protein
VFGRSDLTSRRAGFDAVAGLLADPKTPGWRASALVAGLEPLADCDQVELLGGLVPEPHDPAKRADIGQVRKDFERLQPLVNAGRHEDARTLLRALVARARHRLRPWWRRCSAP